MKIPFAFTDRLVEDLHDEFVEGLNTISKEKLLFTNAGMVSNNKPIDGEYTAIVEKRIAEITGTQYAVLTQSGTNAILLGLISLGANKDQEVIATNYSYVATVNQAALMGVKLKFADVDEYGHIDPSKVEELITDKTVGIITAGLYSDNYDSIRLNEVIGSRNIWILEDSAQSYGASYYGIPNGSHGTVGIVSFARNKPCMGMMGMGALTTNDKNIADIARYARFHGKQDRFTPITGYGINGQPYEISALSVLLSLDRFPKWLNERLEISKAYQTACMEKGIDVRGSREGATSTGHKFVCYAQHLYDHFRGLGIDAGLHYQENFEHSYFGERKREMPITEWFNKNALVLPNDPFMTDNEVEYVVKAIRNS